MSRRDRRPSQAARVDGGPGARQGATREDDAAAKAKHELHEDARLAEEALASAARLASGLLTESGSGAGITGEARLATAERIAADLLATAEEAAVELLATARQASVARLASKHRFEAMFHEHDAVMLLIDPVTGQIVDANPSATEFYGYGVDTMRSMLITQINMMPPVDVADLMAQAESRTKRHFVFPHRLASGEIRRVDVHTSPIQDGQPLLFSIIVDIEDRVRAEEELARVSGYSRTLIEASLDPLVTISAGGLITDVNAATETVTGLLRQALIGSDFADYFTDPEQARVGYLESFHAGSVTDYPLSIRHVDGSTTDVLFNATVYRDAHGNVEGVFAAARDVTQRKRAEEALAKSEHLYRLLSENADGAVLLVSPAGTLIWASPSIERLLGYTPPEVMALDGKGLVHPDDRNAARTTVARGEVPAELTQVRFRRKDGQYRWMAATSRPVTDSDGNLTGRIDSLRDIHEEVLAREALAASEALLRAVLDSSGDTTIRVGLDGRIEFVNRRAVEISGLVSEEWVGRTFEEMGYPAELAQSWDAHRRPVFATGEPATFEFEIDNAEGHRWYESTVAPEITPDGTIAHVIETSRDITDRKETEAALRSSRLVLEQAQRIAHIGSWTLDNATNHVTWSPELYLMQGLDPAGPVPDYTEHSRLFTQASWQELSAALAITQETGVPYQLDLEMVRPDGTRGWMLSRGEAVHDAQGAIVGLVGAALDITERKDASNALQVLATHDPLTGLANRVTLMDEIARAMSAGHRSRRATGVLMMDLDRFKDVNDTLGHAAGDDLLVAAGARIEHLMRAGDLVARLGGDEFVVVMRDLDDPAEAVRAARRLVEAFRAPFTPAGGELYATASIGVAIATGTTEADTLGAGDLLREADTALYAAKEAGRDRVSVFNEDLRAVVTARLAVEADLRHALERGQLAVWYQPEVDLTTGAVTAVEALLRWHHPDGSVWAADRFIDVAEDTGMILDIGDWVLRQTCVQAAIWATARPDRPITVRVNVSPLQFAETGLLPAIDDALATSGLDPGLLCIEITETSLLRQTTTADNNLDGIHHRGIRIAIDDFGTGYASLTYLRRYPIDVLKIDRSFITDTTAPDHEHRLVAGIIALAHGLGITVTAEGVEHPDQATHLREMGCPTAQGFLYSPALPVEQITPLLDHIYR